MRGEGGTGPGKHEVIGASTRELPGLGVAFGAGAINRGEGKSARVPAESAETDDSRVA